MTEKIIDERRKKKKRKGVKDLYYSASSGAVYHPGIKSNETTTGDLDAEPSNGREYQYEGIHDDAKDEHARDNNHDDDDESELKGWKESGYKIVAEVEYLDKGKKCSFFIN